MVSDFRFCQTVGASSLFAEYVCLSCFVCAFRAGLVIFQPETENGSAELAQLYASSWVSETQMPVGKFSPSHP